MKEVYHFDLSIDRRFLFPSVYHHVKFCSVKEVLGGITSDIGRVFMVD